MIKLGDQVLEKPDDIANGFNKYFVNFCETLGIIDKNNENTFTTIIKYVQSKLNDFQTFSLCKITEDNVFRLLNKLNPSQSAGVDTI